MSIIAQLENKTHSEKVALKSTEYLSVVEKETVVRPELEIEIVDINTIQGGVEVFVRAWKDGKQIGFGDGTVDVERFRIINPPILVPDTLGDILIRTEANKKLDLPAIETWYREDPKEALLQVIEENIRVMNVKGDTNIKSGKIGNTTTTVYASPSAYMFNNGTTDWATLRADGTSIGYDDTSATEATLIGELVSAGSWNLARNIYHFDTSAIDDGDTISAATFSVKSTTSAGSGAETTYPANGALVGISGTPDANTSDFGKFGTTRYADTDVTRANFANGVASYKDWAMNATGIAAINKTGTTYLGIRMSNDFSDSTAPTARSYALGYFAASSGTTNDPKLVIEHAAGGGSTFTPPAHTLSLMGVG